MKVVLTGNEGKKQGSKNATLLPLVPEETDPLTKENSVGLLLSTNPGTAGAPQYKMQVRILKGEGEDVRTLLQWRKDVNTVFVGLHLQNAETQNRMLLTLMSSTAQTLYESARDALCEARRKSVATQTYNTTGGDIAAKEAARDVVLDQT